MSVVVGSAVPGPEEIHSGEFRISGIPSLWQSVATPASYVFALGDPFGGGISFGLLEQQSQPCIPIFTVTLTATTQEIDVVLSVEPRDPPTVFDCVVLGLCNPLCDTALCVDGGKLFINSFDNCLVSVQEMTWSALKSLYDTQ